MGEGRIEMKSWLVKCECRHCGTWEEYAVDAPDEEAARENWHTGDYAGGEVMGLSVHSIEPNE